MTTLNDELERARLRLIHFQDMLGHALDGRPRDRHFRGLPECEWVIQCADDVEIAEARIRDLERRIRLQDRVAA